MRKITIRQREVLSLLSEGNSYNEVAEKLYITRKTVRAHVYGAMDRLEANTDIQAVIIYLGLPKI